MIQSTYLLPSYPAVITPPCCRFDEDHDEDDLDKEIIDLVLG